MRPIVIVFISICFTRMLNAAEFEGSIPEWQHRKQTFVGAEENFKKAFQILKDKYVNKNVTEEYLFQAATEGMIAALNSEKEQWNSLLSPMKMRDMDVEMSGTVVGIGVVIDFDDKTKLGRIRRVFNGSAAAKEGIQKDDVVLNVNGKRFSRFYDMVQAIRGKVNETVNIKILRDDRLIDFKVTRAAIKIPTIQSVMIDNTTGYLSLIMFNKNAAQEVRDKLELFKNKKLSKLILDLRSNAGGLFEKGIEVADLFLKPGDVIVKTKSRDGTVKDFKASHAPWSPETRIVILTSEETASTAEVLVATLKENRDAKIVGTKTGGKWTVETIEKLPHFYSIKYSVKVFESPSGKTYEDVGIIPDFEVANPKADDVEIPDIEQDLEKRIEVDPQLKAAIGIKI